MNKSIECRANIALLSGVLSVPQPNEGSPTYKEKDTRKITFFSRYIKCCFGFVGGYIGGKFDLFYTISCD